MTMFDLAGIGIGLSNLSLAALFEPLKLKHRFFDKKVCFDWHGEIIFPDSVMQTSYLKDLVTPIDPCNRHSFLNYLVEKGLFYAFLNTRRTVISRREYEQYCSWVSEKLAENLSFSTDVEQVDFKDDHFVIQTNIGTMKSRHLSIATGLTPRIPECARPYLGETIFHCKSPALQNMCLEGKSVAIIGGGQTGVEIFRNAINGKWGALRDIQVMTHRANLEPLDESSFTNDYFTPNYVETFWGVHPEKKERIVATQKLASDGNTPSYLYDLYNDLYRLKQVEQDPRTMRILACRELTRIEPSHDGYRLIVNNSFLDRTEKYYADVVILCTGFESRVPQAIENLIPRISFDAEGRFDLTKSYAVQWDGPDTNRMYALNFSRHKHGIVDPQSSLMAWRSAIVINDMMGREIYQTMQASSNFVDYGDGFRE